MTFILKHSYYKNFKNLFWILSLLFFLQTMLFPATTCACSKAFNEKKVKPSFEELIESLISKNIFSHTEWEQQRTSDPDLKLIPEVLSKAYKEWGEKGGWKYVRKQANQEKNTDEDTAEH